MTRFGLALATSLASACAGPSRDVVAESHDVRISDPAAALAAQKNSSDNYVYVARRPNGAIGLAEARGIPDEVAIALVNKLADRLNTCVADLAKEGRLADGGAIRAVAAIADDGTVAGLNVKLPPGNAIAANALLCVIAPLRLTTFAPAEADAGARGIAIEAAWGQAGRDGHEGPR